MAVKEPSRQRLPGEVLHHIADQASNVESERRRIAGCECFRPFPRKDVA